MSTMRKRRRRDGERGVELIEFALTFPILLIVVLGIVDFARNGRLPDATDRRGRPETAGWSFTTTPGCPIQTNAAREGGAARLLYERGS